MHRVFVSDKLSAEGLKILSEAPGIEVDHEPGLAPEQLLARIGGYEGLVVRSQTRVTQDVIEAAAKLRVIGRAGIGVDNVDVPAATRKGIVVMNTPGGNNITTAEHAISMMLALARSIPQATASMRAGKWEKGRFMGTEICGKTLGIIGVGNIGGLVADRAQGLYMKIVAYDPYITPEAAARLGVELVTLDELYARADFISIHTPMNQETRRMLSTTAFEKMKKGVRIINCARGGIVDEEALAAAIRNGKVSGAAVDVFEKEPPPADHPLLQLAEVISTPHLGAATSEAQLNVAIAIARQIVDYLSHGVIQNAVNVPSMSPELLDILTPYLTLGDKLGSLQAQLLSGALREVHIEYAGEVADHDVKAVTLAVLRGLLTAILDEGEVNYVNAGEIARDRGIKVVEAKTSQAKGYVNMVTVRVVTAEGDAHAAGVVFGRHVVRLVRINDFFLESVPEGHILLLHNRDVPGVVGTVGNLLGEAKINIARIELGRERTPGMAMSLIHVDEPVPTAVIEKLRTLPTIVSARLIEL